MHLLLLDKAPNRLLFTAILKPLLSHFFFVFFQLLATIQFSFFFSLPLVLFPFTLVTPRSPLGLTIADGQNVTRVLSHHIHARLLNPSLLPSLLLALRTALFPNNSTSTSSTTPSQVSPPSTASIQAIRHRCATAIVDAIPPAILARFLATVSPSDEARESEAEDEAKRRNRDRDSDDHQHHRRQRRDRWIQDVEVSVLDVFGMPYMNKHLLYAIVELVVVRIFPEMAEKSVEDLLRERLG